MLRVAFVLSALLAVTFAPRASAQQFEFCYTIQGGSSSNTGGYAVWTHGYFYTSGTSGTVTITNAVSNRTVINAVGQRHVEQLQGIVTANNRVDTNLYVSPSNGGGYLDGEGIQLPISGNESFANGIGTLLGYNLAQPATIVSAYGQTSQLNANVNPLFSNGQYGERLDAGGSTIYGSSSSFVLQAYSPSQPLSCAVTLYQPLCLNYPATPPDGSTLFNITLNTPWAQVPATYLGDLFAAMTVMLAPSNSQAQYLGFFLFSCYPIFSNTNGAQPRVSFYLNAASVSAMGLSMSSAVSSIQSALQPSSAALNNAYLPTNERGLILAAGCPQLVSNGQYPYYTGLTGCAAATVAPTSTGGQGPAQTPSSSAAAVITPNPGQSSSSSGSSGLSHGAIAGIVVGSVVGALLLLLVTFLLCRSIASSNGAKKEQAEGVPATGNHKQFNDEPSQISTAGETEMA